MRLKLITSANINCGFLDAADADTVRTTLELAVAADVAIGAHPGYPDREDFGRHEDTLPEEQVTTLAFYQVGALAALAKLGMAELRFLKPHGALLPSSRPKIFRYARRSRAAFQLVFPLSDCPTRC